VLELVIEQKAWALVVVPKWPSQWWWPPVVREAWMVVELRPLLVARMFQEVRGTWVVSPTGQVC